MQVKSQPSIGRVHIYRRGGLRWPSRNTSNVSNTMPDTHLLKKVIQADKLGRIDNRCRAVNSMWPIVQTRRLRK